MKIPRWFLNRLIDRAIAVQLAREPDFVIQHDGKVYLNRWFVTGWSRYERGSKPANWIDALKRKLPNIYVHQFLGSDDDRALHDHPWWNASILLLGQYDEHTIAAGGVHHATRRRAGDFKLRPPQFAHRIALITVERRGPGYQAGTTRSEVPCTTLFITGPTVRDWGFHCPKGWRHWKLFVDQRDSGQVGKGCA